MDRVEGPLIHKTRFRASGNGARTTPRTLGDNFIQTLAQTAHARLESARAGGLRSSREGYVERQIKGWNRRWDKAHTDGITRFDDVQRWLVDNMPAESAHHASVLHGDYRIDNAILDPNDPRRLRRCWIGRSARMGDPLMDLGNTLSYWIEADDPAPDADDDPPAVGRAGHAEPCANLRGAMAS